jgi:hypothetical protein
MTEHPAQAFAAEVAKENGFTVEPKRLLDTSYPANYPCYAIALTETSGLVVYEDEPDCVVSVMNEPGRFEPR